MGNEATGNGARIFSTAFLLIALTNILVFMGFQMLVTGLPVYLAQLGANSMQVGLTTTMATVGAVICRPLTGALVDRYGRKGFLVAGFVVMALCCVCYAVFPLVGVILAIRFVHGLGWGFASTANSTIVADILPKPRFGEGMGYFSMTNSLAMALGPALAMWLVESGNSELMIGVAGALTVAAILGSCIAFAFYHEPPRDTTRTLGQALTVKAMFERSAVFPSLVVMLLSLSFGTISTFIAVMGAERGIENLGVYFIVYSLVNVVTRPLVGRWVDRHGFYALGIFSSLCVAASIALIAFANSLALICLAGALVGFGMGTAMCVLNTMAVATAAPPSRGAATSTYLFFFNGGMAVGTFVGGILVDAIGYTGMFLAMAAMAVVACVAFIAGGKERIEGYHNRQHTTG